MIEVNGYITLSSRVDYAMNERILKQITQSKQDIYFGFTRKSFNTFDLCILRRQA